MSVIWAKIFKAMLIQAKLGRTHWAFFWPKPRLSGQAEPGTSPLAMTSSLPCGRVTGNFAYFRSRILYIPLCLLFFINKFFVFFLINEFEAVSIGFRFLAFVDSRSREVQGLNLLAICVKDSRESVWKMNETLKHKRETYGPSSP
jgi:hypothetical protein